MTVAKRAMHTVAWHRICRPTAAGGLGVLILRDTNTALLVKLIWRLLHQPLSLSSSVLTAKYGG